MSAGQVPDSDRVGELLADRAAQGLSDAEARELDRLLMQAPMRSADADAMDLAAAAAYLAMAAAESGSIHAGGASVSVEPMPASIRERIEAGALLRLRESERASTPGRQAGLDTGTPPPPPARQERPYRPGAAPQGAPPPPARGGHSGWMGYTGWAAAATLLAIAGARWWMGPGAQPPASVAPATQAAGLRATLLAEHGGDLVRAAWVNPKDGAAQPGDVVWHNGRQEGYIRVASLPVNDPRESQYQLWIIDPAQEHPIDGGVFDVAAPGEATVPIRPGLPVSSPAAFAVTVERPGGVVVSDRERMPLFAPVSR